MGPLSFKWRPAITGLIMPSGSMRAHFGGARTITTLSAVSFPGASARWHKLKLINGWHDAISNLAAAAPSYLVSHGVFYLTGRGRHPSSPACRRRRSALRRASS